MLLGDLSQILHLVLAILTVIVLEVEVLGHQGINPQHIQNVVDMVQLRTVLLVQLIFLHPCQNALAVDSHQRTNGLVTVLRPFLVAVHLELDDHLFFQQEMMQPLERYTLCKGLPRGKVVLILLVSDCALQQGIVIPGLHQDLADDLVLSFPVFLASDLVQHREQEDDLISFVQDEEGIVLDQLRQLVILA